MVLGHDRLPGLDQRDGLFRVDLFEIGSHLNAYSSSADNDNLVSLLDAGLVRLEVPDRFLLFVRQHRPRRGEFGPRGQDEVIKVDPLGALPFAVKLEVMREDRQNLGLDKVMQVRVGYIRLLESMRVWNERLVLVLRNHREPRLLRGETDQVSTRLAHQILVEPLTKANR
jgi:hypothetical protein